jgi:hypothetical protein
MFINVSVALLRSHAWSYCFTALGPQCHHRARHGVGGRRKAKATLVVL